jgi:hypothetical protein
MHAMTPEEALEELKCCNCHQPSIEAIRLARAALAEKVAAEQAEKPTPPSLQEQEAACRLEAIKIGHYAYITKPRLFAAAETLKLLREEIVPWVQSLARGLDIPALAEAAREAGLETPEYVSASARAKLRKLGMPGGA